MNFVNASVADEGRSFFERARREARFGPIFEIISLVRRRWGLIAASVVAVLCVAVAYLAFSVPIYRATIELYIDPQALQVVGKGLKRSDTAASIEFAGIDSQALVLTSSTLLEAVINDLDLTRDPFLAAGSTSNATRPTTVLDTLRQRIVVHRVDASLVFQVTVSHPNAEQAAKIANAIGSAYFKLSSKERSQVVGQASATLVGQSTQLRNELAKADEAVESFKVKTGLISTGEAGLLVSQQLKDLYTQISLSEANLPRLAARRNELKKVSAADVAAETGATPEAILSPVIGALRAQYASVVQNEAQAARTLGDRHPDLSVIREQKRAVLDQIRNELGRIGKSSDEEYRRAQESLVGLKKQAATLVNSQIASDEAKIKLRQLESEARAIRGLYDESTTRAKELQQQQQIETNNSRVISEAAVPLRPSGTPKALVLITGTLFGLILGFALAYLRDLVSGAPETAPVANDDLQLPITATLNVVGADGVRVPEDSRALIEIAKSFQTGVDPNGQAILIVAGRNAADNARIADDITEVLVWRGGTVFRGRGGFSANTSFGEIVSLPAGYGNEANKQGGSARYAVIDVITDKLMSDTSLAGIASRILLVARTDQAKHAELQPITKKLDPDQNGRRTGRLSLICLQPEPQPIPQYVPGIPSAQAAPRRAA
jgi:uncharacterized protein involved in exopolysaccharide biosynthesis